MQVISTDINVPLTLLDLDVVTGATARSNVYANAEGTKACTVELRVTLLGAQPVNLALRVLGQLSTPAADPTTLLPLNVALPDTSALAANYTRIFVLPVFTPFSQLEVQNISGGNVHVTAYVQGCDAEFVDAAASSTGSLVQLAAGSADAGTFHLATGGIVALAAGAAVIGHAILDASAAAIGKLAANSGVNIGSVDVLSLPSLVLAAGAAAIGKLAANAGVNIGTVDVAVYTPFIDTVASANTTANAYGTSQVVKGPAFVRAARTMTGTVTISDGSRTGMALSAGDSMPVYCTNLNTITYQFSVNAGTEKFSISAGI